jgi:hypothetical protein
MLPDARMDELAAGVEQAADVAETEQAAAQLGLVAARFFGQRSMLWLWERSFHPLPYSRSGAGAVWRVP